MASPQLENGYIKIANEIAEALCGTNLSPYESRVVWAILRKTYGYNKKEDWLPISQLVSLTGMHKAHISRTKKKLLQRNIVTQTGNKMAFNKDYTCWRELPKQAHTPKQVTRYAYTGNKDTPIQADSKDKRQLSKEKDLEKFVSYWNNHSKKSGVPAGIKIINPSVKHRLLKECRAVTPDIREEWNKHAKKYNYEDMQKAVDEYIKEICSRKPSREGYYTHRFSLYDFLRRKGGLKRFINEL